jgi:putative glutamine amidotransferase
MIIPYTEDDSDIEQIGDMLDGLLLTGGRDVDPGCYDEEPIPGLGALSAERDRLELMLARQFLKVNKPIFAICRGHQLLNVAAGGTLYQDINTQLQVIQHQQNAQRNHLHHSVTAVEGSRLHHIAGAERFKVNSFHHQAIKNLAPGFKVTATASDGIIEAIEGVSNAYVLGVQWHPEKTAATDAVSERLFTTFVEACRVGHSQEVISLAAR